MNKKKVRIGVGLLLFIGIFAVDPIVQFFALKYIEANALLAGLSDSQATAEIGRLSSIISIIGFIFKLIIAIPAMVILYKAQYVEKFKKIFTFKNILLIVLMTFGVIIAEMVWNTILLNVFPTVYDQTSSNQEEIRLMLQNTTPLNMFLILVIIGPIIEEFLFRYLLIDEILIFLPRIAAGIISVIIFAAIHSMTELTSGDLQLAIYTVCQYIPSAVIFVAVYLRTNNIYMSSAVHILANGFSFLIMLSI